MKSSLCKSIAISSALYGCELWHSISAVDLLGIEKLWRLCAKRRQCLPTGTRTDMALGLLGWLPLEADIDKRKLSFLQTLCSMPSENLYKELFTFRLHLFISEQYKDQYGFLPEIFEENRFKIRSTYVCSIMGKNNSK